MSAAEFRVPHPDVAALLERCRVLDVALTVEDGRLVADGPDTAEVDALLTEVAAAKAAVLDVLRASHYSQNAQHAPHLLPATDRQRAVLLALAGAAGWPPVRLWTGYVVGPGGETWRATVPKLNRLGAAFAQGALERRVAGVPDGVTWSEFHEGEAG